MDLEGTPYPKQFFTNMSLALLAAVVRAFTQYNNLTNYISACFQLLSNIQQDTPTYFIRCDVAHIIILVTTWKPLQSVDKRVKDCIVRSIAQIILSDDIDDLKQLLRSFFGSFRVIQMVIWKIVIKSSVKMNDHSYDNGLPQDF
ncbi:unnamed protein product [Macrosiphum euphorbiae]|uniref:Uncharacterized protein n=1 Tax=Macrosiphum euphorbiae TaxID=13131 RepID=A0AAV0WSZ3_9HEMI|nr:unnamed protein product [Macrosiphum euphorbiae]